MRLIPDTVLTCFLGLGKPTPLLVSASPVGKPRLQNLLGIGTEARRALIEQRS